MPRAATGNPNGRPPKVVNLTTVQKLAELHCTQEEIAAVLGVSVDTLTRREGFAESQATGAAKGRVSLRRSQFQSALSGNTRMQTWLGMQLLGQRNQTSTELSGPQGGPIETVNLSQLSNDQLLQLESILEQASKPDPSPDRVGISIVPRVC